MIRLYKPNNIFKHSQPREDGNGRKMMLFIKTGEFRAPVFGEYYLSGAIPEVYQAHGNFAKDSQFHIVRQATYEETHCGHCGQFLSNKVVIR
jgi:hypothetical protein